MLQLLFDYTMTKSPAAWWRPLTPGGGCSSSQFHFAVRFLLSLFPCSATSKCQLWRGGYLPMVSTACLGPLVGSLLHRLFSFIYSLLDTTWLRTASAYPTRPTAISPPDVLNRQWALFFILMHYSSSALSVPNMVVSLCSGSNGYSMPNPCLSLPGGLLLLHSHGKALRRSFRSSVGLLA